MIETLREYRQEPSGVTIRYDGLCKYDAPITIRLDQYMAPSSVDMFYARLLLKRFDAVGRCDNCGPACPTFALRVELNPLETIYT